MINEKVPFKIIGTWKDILRFSDGRVEERGGNFERHNQIQNTFATLLAGMCSQDAAFSGITYIALGEGLAGWDLIPPATPYIQTTLVSEGFRKALVPADFMYLDPATDLPSATPTSKIEVTALIANGDANGLSLREFGLFGGTATIAFDSGEMVDWIVHSRIDKDASLEIQRLIRIEFVTL